jgi:hypothetical protein
LQRGRYGAVWRCSVNSSLVAIEKPAVQVFIGKVSATIAQPPAPVLEFGSFCCGAVADKVLIVAVFLKNGRSM